VDDLRENWGKDKEWEPEMDSKEVEKGYKMWKKAVTRTFDWLEPGEDDPAPEPES